MHHLFNLSPGEAEALSGVDEQTCGEVGRELARHVQDWREIMQDAVLDASKRAIIDAAKQTTPHVLGVVAVELSFIYPIRKGALWEFRSREPAVADAVGAFVRGEILADAAVDAIVVGTP